MSYTPTNWQDRITEKINTYTMTENPDGTVTLTPVPGTVTQAGTPINAANLNRLEQEVAALSADSEGLDALIGNGIQ